MVTVSSAFMSSRRERIIFRVLSASGCAFKAAAWVDVLRAGLVAVCLETLGKTDLDNTDVARDHSFHCIAGVESFGARHHSMHVGLMVSISSVPQRRVSRVLVFLPVVPHELRKLQGAGNLMLSSQSAQETLQLPSWFRRPVDDR